MAFSQTGPRKSGGGAQKLIDNLQYSEIARFLSSLTLARKLAFSLRNLGDSPGRSPGHAVREMSDCACPRCRR
jgi:hypothetical protein